MTAADQELRGRTLLNSPIRNRGTAFTAEERARLRLRGLLPPGVETLEQQVNRVIENSRAKPNDLERYIFLMALQDRNETLFYRTVLDHLERLMPVIYTPTVGEAAERYGYIFRRPRGLYVTAEDRGSMEEVLRNWPETDVRVIVVTDGNRILGLGDLGANGMAIPVGKLALYTAAGGIPPASTLPVLLDVGTDNETLRNGEFYLGLRRERITGDAYLELVDEFVEAASRTFPDAVIQFEDFATENAFLLLDRYRDRGPVMNDDIQGTAAVALAGLLAALRVTGEDLAEQTLLFVGAGSANTGIADLVVRAMTETGIPLEEARRRCWFTDSKGLIVEERGGFRPHNARYAHSRPPMTDLVEIVRTLRPRALIGATGTHGVFPRAALEAMAAFHERPIVFALSNPTSRAEVTAEEAYAWTGGRCLFASGSPFGPVEHRGRTHVPGQANNVYIFPGIGLAATAGRIRRITDRMFLAAARAVAEGVSAELLDRGSLFPPLDSIRKVSLSIAEAVLRNALDSGTAGIASPEDLRAHLQSRMYEPDYRDPAV